MDDYLEQMNYGSMYGNSAYPTTMPANAMTPTQTGTSGNISGMHGNTGQAAQKGQAGMRTPQLTGWQKFGYVMDGLGAIGGLWGAIQKNKIAKQQLALSKEAYNTNMNNTIKSYNTALEDRIRARYIMEGRSDEADAYISEHKLSR